MSSFWKRLFNFGNHPGLHSQEIISFQRDDSDWKAVFDDASVLINGPKQIEEAQTRIMSRLSRVYQVFDRLSRKQAAFIQGVIQAVDYCEGLDPRPTEIKAVHDLLLGVLDDQDVTPWLPTTGKLIPEGCEPISEEISADFSSQTILKVLTPGYLWKDGTILRRPRVVVSRQPSKDTPQVNSSIQSQSHINAETKDNKNK